MSSNVIQKPNRLGRHLDKKGMILGRGFIWDDYHHHSYNFWDYLHLRIAQALQEPLKDHLVKVTK